MGMKATFHFGQDPETHVDRDVEIEAGKIDKVVTLRVLGGWNCSGGASGERSERVVLREFPMTKAQARALGSAFMGCAAEIEG